MKTLKSSRIKTTLLSGMFCCFSGFITAQSSTTLEVDASKTVAEIAPTMYGIFFEDINFAADGGLYAELIKNRSFEFDNPLMGWDQPNSDRHSYNKESGIAVPVKYSKQQNNHNFIRVEVKDANGYKLINKGYRGIGIHKDEHYRLSFLASKKSGEISQIHFKLLDEAGKLIGSSSVSLSSGNWKKYQTKLTASTTVEKAGLEITFSGQGEIDLDMISMFPENTWNNRENGMREDLVQLLADMNPGFLRFPGGCIVEGRTLAERYQWKKTVGPVVGREILINRWNTEFSHRLTPDYYQSFGIGFFEYFRLAEDIGATPLPILSCGIACQFNTGELVPMDQLDPYVQDALDLIEFANGSVDTPWGKVRADMGHPESFDLKYIGVGNEQWGPDYIERYKVFNDAIKKQYPDIIIVSGSGPFPEGDYFEYGMEQLNKLGAEIIDEHYYKSPEWFRENADRYDSYNRNGPKIFAGEYAAQSVAIASPQNENNWECALSEAAFMTGLERNADVVQLTSYAPLMAHTEAWQWTPDLIWFDNLSSYGTPNYYVQKMFATNRGSDLLKVSANGEKLIGQNELYASAVKEASTSEIIVKVVNTASIAKTINFNIKGVNIGKKADQIVLTSDDLGAVNSIDKPKNIAPVTKNISVNKGVELAPYSVNVIKLRIEK
ncbi:alpha-L-arabinofuranosidase C-terminal domain-containing protein [Galbibacter sp.]|uniref:alpha-L-arabinofuranosidase C-terminal domain-containing protein n=1 Tax=Galbibacter sp. TaxID=2918471 RepID=UPI003A91B739